ncbi:MAG: TIGR02253 family HAD-type hydrolase [Candidatus Altiarchaeota archaeon]
MDVKAVFFDIDNTLFDTKRLAEATRRNAIRAMIESGLDVDEDEAYVKLMELVKKHGSNYGRHFDELLKIYGKEGNPHIIAAGIIAYHSTKTAYLVPYPETVPTLISIRDRGIKLGIITDGVAVKQWEKLISLGLQHFFHSVVISEERGVEKPETTSFLDACDQVDCKPDEAIMVGDRLEKDVLGANIAGMTSVLLDKHIEGDHPKPKSEREEPDYIISQLGDLLKILDS